MNGKLKTKRTYKIIVCCCIWLAAIVAACCLAFVNSQAGVIVEETFQLTNITTINAASGDNLYLPVVWGSGNYEILNLTATATYNNINLSSRCRAVLIGNEINNTWRCNIYIGTPGRQVASSTIEVYGINDDMYINLSQAFDYISTEISDLTFTITSQYIGGYPDIYKYANKKINTISQVSNIYDLKQNDVALIYISDISGISSTMTNELTINWGYIDASDNQVFTVNAPKVGAQLMESGDLIIRLSLPTNGTGTTSNTYDISQQAILSLGTGSATATAHIYGLYVWLQSNRIQWGLAEFDTTSTPASGYSMNYITSLTSIYDYTAVNTQTMTCRLSISDNFNFITIKNQPILSANNINTVIRQGGFLPAWALYNWARGSASGYISGEQAGAAPYQPGNEGYQEIFEAGRQAGINANIGTVNWFISAFSAVDAMLNIRIFPNITIGYLVGIPFVISVVWFIIRMFRGGGSSS